MIEDPIKHSEGSAVRTVKAHQFVVMIIGVVLVSVFLVYVALSLYRSSGALQLDLSRPGYDTAREEASRDNEVFRGISADGPINDEVLSKFDELYQQKSAEGFEIDPFSGDALSDQALLLDRD